MKFRKPRLLTVRRNQTDSERGLAIIELALIMPLFVAVALVGLEISRALSYSQAAVSLSREAASRAFRKCGSDWSADTANAAKMLKVRNCLEKQEAALEQFANRAFPGTEVILTIFRYGAPGAAVTCTAGNMNAGFTRVSRAGTGTYQTTFLFKNNVGVYDPALSTGSAIRGIDTQTACLTRVIVAAEVYIPYSSVSGRGASLFSYNPQEFYSAATL